MLEYLDSLKPDLISPFQTYTKKLKGNSAEYPNIIQLKNANKPIAIVWKILKTGCLQFPHSQSCSNESGNIVIEYSLEIKCELDYIA